MRKEIIKRSVAKSATFRVLVMLADGIIIYLITKDLLIAGSVIVFSNISSTIIYYFHERVWSKIRWGMGKKRKD
ncbi:DUF2061 domain-containing protein [Patescibacteria group bacterium]